MLPLYVAGGVVVGLVLLAVIFRMLWRVAEPNEALIISGLGARVQDGSTDGLGFKVVTGKGVLLVPGFQTARRLSLDSKSTNLYVACVTKQGIPVSVRGVVIYKVGDDTASIANAARRFLDQQNAMNATIHELFSGHLRSIVGSLTIEEMIHNRDALTAEVRQSTSVELSKLGLVVDSLQIQEIDEASGYITNLGKPHAAAVAAQARIAEAQRDQEATQAEQIAAAKKAAAIRESQIQQAGYQAEVDQAAATAKQAGPLAEASARQEVVVAETRAAQLEADLAEQRLQSQVRKPADARAYETVTVANAQRDARISAAEAEAQETELRATADAIQVKTAAAAAAEATLTRAEANAKATRATGEAEAAAARARGLAAADAARAAGLAAADAAKAAGLAEAEAIEARAGALATNQEAVVAQQLAERWPDIVAAGARAFSSIDHMVVLNGADGVSDLFTKAMALGGTGIGLARNILSGLDMSGSTGSTGSIDIEANAEAGDPPHGANPSGPGKNSR